MIVNRSAMHPDLIHVRASYPDAARIVPFGTGWVVFETEGELDYWISRSRQTTHEVTP